MPADSTPLVPPRLILGIVVIVLGALFLADSAGVLRADSALAFWPVALVALGLVVVLQPDPANRMVGALLLIAGVWLLLNGIGVWTYRFWRTWPYLLILFGAWMIYRVHWMHARERDRGLLGGFAFLNRADLQPGDAPVAAGEFSAVGGQCSVDLRDAWTASTNAIVIVDVFALFGRISLRVPSGWNVDNRVLPLLGQAGAVPPQPDSAGPTMVVQGSAICGSVTVVH